MISIRNDVEISGIAVHGWRVSDASHVRCTKLELVRRQASWIVHGLVNIEKANWKMTIYSGVLIGFNGDLMGFNGIYDGIASGTQTKSYWKWP